MSGDIVPSDAFGVNECMDGTYSRVIGTSLFWENISGDIDPSHALDVGECTAISRESERLTILSTSSSSYLLCV